MIYDTGLSANSVFLKDSAGGLNVCLHCFNGGCTGTKNHGALHNRRSTHPLALNIRRTRKSVQV